MWVSLGQFRGGLKSGTGSLRVSNRKNGCWSHVAPPTTSQQPDPGWFWGRSPLKVSREDELPKMGHPVLAGGARRFTPQKSGWIRSLEGYSHHSQEFEIQEVITHGDVASLVKRDLSGSG
jgi:hypothetical protein